MYDPADEPSFRLDVAGLPAPLEVLAFTGREVISEPFAFEIDVLIDDPQLNLAGLLHRPAFLMFGPVGNGVHGQLQSLVQHEHGQDSRLCRIHLGPRLGFLQLRFSQRVFSARSIPQILAQVLKEHGITGRQCRFELRCDYPARTYCTQYRESDLQFVERLCAQARIHYSFEHARDGHCLVFGDDPAQLPRMAPARFIHDLQDRSGAAPPAVRQWQVSGTRPADGHPSPVSPTGVGRTDLPTLRSGAWLPLHDHPFIECNRDWLLTRVEHHADQCLEPPYGNRIFAAQHAFYGVPGGERQRLHMQSLQRAWVVSVDEDRPDDARPVAVQFDWLYQGEGASASHCWLPLAPALAKTPSLVLRDGVEVVVSFLEGDPDQPVISGVLQAPLPGDDSEGEACTNDPLPHSERFVSDGFCERLKAAEPLLLLCLITGGGSYSHCAQTVCSCRLMARLDQSGGR